jgi:hypothetical protein
MAVQGDGVEVEWHEPVDPRMHTVDEVEVECHLYDDDALVEAERRRLAGGRETTTGGSSPPVVSV